MTRSEVAEYCGVTKSAVTHAVQRGNLECQESGQISRAEAERWNSERGRHGKPSRRVAIHQPDKRRPVKLVKKKQAVKPPPQQIQKFESQEIEEHRGRTFSDQEDEHRWLTLEKLRLEVEKKKIDNKIKTGEFIDKKKAREWIECHYSECRALAMNPPVPFLVDLWKIASDAKTQDDFLRLSMEAVKDSRIEMVGNMRNVIAEFRDSENVG